MVGSLLSSGTPSEGLLRRAASGEGVYVGTQGFGGMATNAIFCGAYEV